MKVLVVGSGGREHALCWKLAQSPRLEKLYCAPGNPGIDGVAETVAIAGDDVESLVAFAAERGIDLTVVGPELPLVLGLADALRERDLGVFGPCAAAARLEGSKVFAKEFMNRHGISTANFVVVESAAMAREALPRFGLPVVLKADGLAAGKGVLIPGSEREFEEALRIFFDERRFGAGGERVVMEAHLTGEEVSMIALCDGHQVMPLATSKDYKRIGEGDTGPNTGGMGAHSPAGVLGPGQESEIVAAAMEPVIAGMAADGHLFSGVLYAGMILTEAGPQVLEYNVRLGDPEAQPLLMRLDGDLLPVLAAAAGGGFGGETLSFKKGAAACVVLASSGYPGTPVKGEPISGLEAAEAMEEVEVFHAGTSGEAGRIVSAGGRVLNVCATGPDLRAALERAYRATAEISWASKTFRRDIGLRVAGRA